MKTLQLNNSLCTQLSNVAMLFNAAYAFQGKHIAVIFNGPYPRVELAERVERMEIDGDSVHFVDDMDCCDLISLRTDADVIDAIMLVTKMHIEQAL